MAKASPLQTEGDAQEGAVLDRIYNDPTTTHALDLFERFSKRELAGEGLRAYLDTLPADSAPERTKLEGLLSGAESTVQIDLSTRSNQLVWAAGLYNLRITMPENRIRTSPLWRAACNHPILASTLQTASRALELAPTISNFTISYGLPGSGFYCDPTNKHINIDPAAVLNIGIEKLPETGQHVAVAISSMLHEVFHAIYTTRFTDRMIELEKREKELLQASEGRKLTPDEFKELTRVRKEFQLRLDIMNPAEDNPANSFASNQDLPYDLPRYSNIKHVLYNGTGQHIWMAERGEIPELPDTASDEIGRAHV